MIEQDILCILQFENLANEKSVIHFSTSRTGGVSSGHLSSLNLGFTVGDNPVNVKKNQEILLNSLKINDSKIIFPKQTHSTNVGIVKTRNDIFPDTDALITNTPGICIAIRTADCVPVLLYDPVQNAVAAIHSGWKGTVQKISKKTIQLMQQEFGTNPKNLIAGIGPSIGPTVYEVGSEVIQVFDKEFDNNNFFTPIQNSEKEYLDLWKANKQVLLESGIPHNQIEIAGMCTFLNSKLFFSARRDKGKTGRLATGIMLK